MRDLLNDLNELDKEKYNVSLDFSKKIMTKIDKEKRYGKILHIASLGVAACLIGVCVFTVNKVGVFERINVASSNSISSDKSAGVNDVIDYLPSENEQIVPESIREQETNITESSQVYNSSITNLQSEESLDSIPASAPQSDINNVEYKEARISDNSNKTYSKQMDKKTYIEDILNALKDNKFDAEYMDDDNAIFVHSTDFTSVYQVLENYIDILIEIKDDGLIIKLN